MSTTLDQPAATPDDHAGTPAVTIPPATHRRRGLALLAVGLFQVWLWTTRLWNLVQDPEPRTTAFVVVHAVLYVAAFGAAGVLLAIGWRTWREARAAAAP